MVVPGEIGRRDGDVDTASDRGQELAPQLGDIGEFASIERGLDTQGQSIDAVALAAISRRAPCRGRPAGHREGAEFRHLDPDRGVDLRGWRTRKSCAVKNRCRSVVSLLLEGHDGQVQYRMRNVNNCRKRVK